MQEGSKRYKLNGTDLKKIGMGGLMAIIGAIITYLVNLIPTIDFGLWTPFIAGFLGTVVNSLRKFASDNSDMVTIESQTKT